MHCLCMEAPFYIVASMFLFSMKPRCLANNTECGVRPSFRIQRVIGGHAARPHSWPWQADIQYMNSTGYWKHKCGASLVHPQWVVTAAHCLTVRPDSRIRIVLGEHDRANEEGPKQYFHAKTRCIHKRFDLKASYGYDIALIKLSSPAKLSQAVGLVCLPKQNQRIAIGEMCYITGWGIYQPGGPRAKILQEAQMPVVNYSTCSKGNSHFQPVDDEVMLCAGFGGNSTVSGCNGDSGGPLSCKEGGKFVLRGVVNWGIPECPAGETFSVFARISHFVDWIEERIRDSDICSNEGVQLKSADYVMQIIVLGYAYLLK